MSAWGKTGRVTRDSRDILVDGMPVGYACAGYAEVYAERLGKSWTTTAAPSLDAAVLWVLRRVDPALWRQERGEVWRVRTYKYARGWHAIDPEDGQCQGCLRDFPSTIARAHDLAARRAATR